MAGTETAPGPASQPPSNRQPGEEFPAPSQTETDSPTIADGAVREDEGTLDWVLRLSNAVHHSLAERVCKWMLESKPPNRRRGYSLSSNHAINSIANGELISESPVGYSGGSRATRSNASHKCGHQTDLHHQGSTVSVATVYSVNNFDAPQIQSLLKSLPQTCTGDE